MMIFEIGKGSLVPSQYCLYYILTASSIWCFWNLCYFNPSSIEADRVKLSSTRASYSISLLNLSLSTLIFEYNYKKIKKNYNFYFFQDLDLGGIRLSIFAKINMKVLYALTIWEKNFFLVCTWISISFLTSFFIIYRGSNKPWREIHIAANRGKWSLS